MPIDPTPQVIRLPQDRETALTTHQTAVGTALVLYSRSNDSIDADVVGQDYLVFKHGPGDLTFAVCDGVGQSFMGDLAASLLGDAMIEWLWTIERPADAEAFRVQVTGYLNALIKETGPKVEAYRLPPALPPILVQALEMQRKYGSESMMVAGRVCVKEGGVWAALAWLGDSPMAAIDVDGKLVDIGPNGHTSERWNATTGVKGNIHTWVGGGDSIARVAGYTDGLGMEGEPVDDELASLIESWENNPPGDDATLFDLRIAPSPATTGSTGPISVPEGMEKQARIGSTAPINPETESSPTSGVSSIKNPASDTGAVGEWRPLTGQPESGKDEQPSIPGAVAALGLPTSLSDEEIKALEQMMQSGSLTEQQQIRTWQNLAMMGLTGAALAMLMIERLIEQGAGDGGKKA